MYKNMNCIINGKIILEQGVLEGSSLIFNDKITGIFDEENFARISKEQALKIIDARGQYVSPGFIDIHIHGSGGKDTMDGTPSDLLAISEAIAACGVTGFLPTTISMETARIHQALATVRQAMKIQAAGACILGVHMEGPFISPKLKGAHRQDFLAKPDFEVVRHDLDIIKIITMAPEEDSGFEFIRRVLNNSDVVISMGHTDSDYETAMAAISAGIKSATHIFNAMPPIHHRAPGAAGAALKSNIFVELIADTRHIHPALFQMLIDVKGKDKLILVTDAMRAGLMGEGSWELGGQAVIVGNESARLENGTLAGSILTMNKAVKNIMEHTDLKLFEAVALASLNPASLLNMAGSKGSISLGKDADLIIFDEGFSVELTIAKGKVIYDARPGVVR